MKLLTRRLNQLEARYIGATIDNIRWDPSEDALQRLSDHDLEALVEAINTLIEAPGKALTAAQRIAVRRWQAAL